MITNKTVRNIVYYISTASVVSNFGRGLSPILSKNIQCTIDDDALSGCATTELDISQCQHVAGLICVGM